MNLIRFTRRVLTVAPVAGVLVALLQAGAAYGQGLKIGFVDAAAILEQAPQAQTALQKLDEEFGAREAGIRSSQERLRELEALLNKDGDVVGGQERARLEREIVATRRDVKRAQADFREDYNLRRNQALTRLQTLVQDAIVELAKDESFDLIVSDGVVWASDRINITDLVIERLKR